MIEKIKIFYSGIHRECGVVKINYSKLFENKEFKKLIQSLFLEKVNILFSNDDIDFGICEKCKNLIEIKTKDNKIKIL